MLYKQYVLLSEQSPFPRMSTIVPYNLLLCPLGHAKDSAKVAFLVKWKERFTV